MINETSAREITQPRFPHRISMPWLAVGTWHTYTLNGTVALFSGVARSYDGSVLSSSVLSGNVFL